MFPIDTKTMGYDRAMLKQFASLHSIPGGWKLCLLRFWRESRQALSPKSALSSIRAEPLKRVFPPREDAGTGMSRRTA